MFPGRIERVMVGSQFKIGFSLKSNSNSRIMELMKNQGLMAVAVSGFEIRAALSVGFAPSDIMYNGNGKTDPEIQFAIDHEIPMNVDSVFNARQLVNLNNKKLIRVLIRLNIDKTVGVHPYLQTVSQDSKFGVVPEDLPKVLEILKEDKNIKIIGLHCHLGSTIKDTEIYAEIFETLKDTVHEYSSSLEGVEIINIGGGLAIDYQHDQNPDGYSYFILILIDYYSAYAMLGDPSMNFL